MHNQIPLGRIEGTSITVLRQAPDRRVGKRQYLVHFYLCRCEDCGKKWEVVSQHLTGKQRNCGCKRRPFTQEQKKNISQGKLTSEFTKHSQKSRDLMSAAKKGVPQTLDGRLSRSKGKTGREPVLSPFVPDAFVSFNTKQQRWHCGSGRAHARVVWEHNFGLVPKGFDVHHKTGDATKLENDAPNLLMLLPQRWNRIIIPVLSRLLWLPEAEITKAYLEVQHLPDPEIGLAILRVLVRKMDDA